MLFWNILQTSSTSKYTPRKPQHAANSWHAATALSKSHSQSTPKSEQTTHISLLTISGTLSLRFVRHYIDDLGPLNTENALTAPWSLKMCFKSWKVHAKQLWEIGNGWSRCLFLSSISGAFAYFSIPNVEPLPFSQSCLAQAFFQALGATIILFDCVYSVQSV